MPARLNIKHGDRYGRLTVVRELPKIRNHLRIFLCRCDCGNERGIRLANLPSGNTESCGCLRMQHGRCKDPVYKRWEAMIGRCRNKTNAAYGYYGGRGIVVCDRWLDFSNFLSDMGEPPAGLTLERIDNSLGYSKSNCRWASRAEQMRNTRRTRLLTALGRTMCVMDWAKETGIQDSTIHGRLDRGWDVEAAVSTPAWGRA